MSKRIIFNFKESAKFAIINHYCKLFFLVFSMFWAHKVVKRFASGLPKGRIDNPQIISAFRSNVQYLFRYSGAFPDSKIQKQFKEQVRKLNFWEFK